MRWVEYVARMGDSIQIYRFLVGETWGEKDQLEEGGLVGRIILRWIFRKWD